MHSCGEPERPQRGPQGSSEPPEIPKGCMSPLLTTCMCLPYQATTYRCPFALACSRPCSMAAASCVSAMLLFHPARQPCTP